MSNEEDQLQALILNMQGVARSRIAEQLSISERTVSKYVARPGPARPKEERVRYEELYKKAASMAKSKQKAAAAPAVIVGEPSKVGKAEPAHKSMMKQARMAPYGRTRVTKSTALTSKTPADTPKETSKGKEKESKEKDASGKTEKPAKLKVYGKTSEKIKAKQIPAPGKKRKLSTDDTQIESSAQPHKRRITESAQSTRQNPGKASISKRTEPTKRKSDVFIGVVVPSLSTDEKTALRSQPTYKLAKENSKPKAKAKVKAPVKSKFRPNFTREPIPTGMQKHSSDDEPDYRSYDEYEDRGQSSESESTTSHENSKCETSPAETVDDDTSTRNESSNAQIEERAISSEPNNTTSGSDETIDVPTDAEKEKNETKHEEKQTKSEPPSWNLKEILAPITVATPWPVSTQAVSTSFPVHLHNPIQSLSSLVGFSFGMTDAPPIPSTIEKEPTEDE